MENAVVGTRISSSGQATIPSAIRDTLRVKTGDTIYWHASGREAAFVSPMPAFRPSTSQEASPLFDRESETPVEQGGVASMTAIWDSNPSGPPLPGEWPSSFWATLGALDDPSFVIPPELDYADDAPRLSFD